jgi:hypothetical protein
MAEAEDQGQEPENNGQSEPGNGESSSSQEPDGLEGLPPQTRDELRRLRGEARAMRRERNTLRDELKQISDRDKTEEQRTREALATAEGRATRAEGELLRFRVAAEVGLSAEWADRLRGETREELETDAKALLERVNGGEQSSSQTNFNGGVRTPVRRPQTMNDLIRQAAGKR